MRSSVSFAAILLLLGSGQVIAGKRGPSSVRINETAAGHPSHIRIGETLQITLAETPTTGYRWRLGTGCANLLERTDEQQSSNTTQPGAPGEHRWSFLAKTAGQCELRFESVRSWEKAVTGKTMVFPVVIASAK